MEPTKQLPNIMMYFILTQLEGILGKNGINTVLKYSNLSRLIDNYPPQDYSPGETVGTFSIVFTNLMDIYGEKGFLAVVRGAGKTSFYQMMDDFPGLFGIGELELDGLSPVERFKTIYKTYINNVTQMFGTATTIKVEGDRILEDMPDCPWCVDLKANGPVCIIEVDFITGMGLWAGVEGVSVEETHCKAKGDEVCRLLATW